MNDATNTDNILTSVKPRGVWQTEFLRELAEMGEPATWETVVSATNAYDAQLTDRVGEGSTAEGRTYLRALIRAGNALGERLAKMM